MLEGIEIRGGDATGFAALFDNGELRVEKAAVKSDKFVKKKCFKELGKNMPRSLIMHTRRKTKGTPTNNHNNHPILIKEAGIALVHNGSISNDDDVFKHLKMPRIAEVDSEVLARIFAQEGTFEAGVKKIGEVCTGTVAFAMLNTKYPDHLYIGRNSNPIELLLDTERDILFFSSLSASVKKAYQIELEVKRWRGFPLPKLGTLEQPTMTRDSAYVIGPKGIKKVLEFDTQWTNPFEEKKKHAWSGWGGWTGNKAQAQAHAKVRPSGSICGDKWKKWIKFDSGKSHGSCEFCLRGNKDLRYIPKAEMSMCQTCYASVIIEPGPVAMIRCDRCFGPHPEEMSVAHSVYNSGTDSSQIDHLCSTCWATIQDTHCVLCGKYKGVVGHFQEGVGHLCHECNAGQYGA